MNEPGDTKTRILDTAERLFGDRGFAATSLRTITTEAGVNLASVNYHFGSKEALLAEILGRRFGPINQERLSLLEAAEAGDGGSDLEGIVRAFYEPAFEALSQAGEESGRFMQLIGRIHTEPPDAIREIFASLFEEVFQRFAEALQRALPQLSPDEVQLRMHFSIGAMAHTLAWASKAEWILGKKILSTAVRENLVQFAVAGLRAPAKVPELEAERTS